MAMYHLRVGETGMHFFVLQSDNDECIVKGEPCKTESDARAAISACRLQSARDSQYRRRRTKSGLRSFILRAADDSSSIGVSPRYDTKALRDLAIEACKRFGPSARVAGDTTIPL